MTESYAAYSLISREKVDANGKSTARFELLAGRYCLKIL